MLLSCPLPSTLSLAQAKIRQTIHIPSERVAPQLHPSAHQCKIRSATQYICATGLNLGLRF